MSFTVQHVKNGKIIPIKLSVWDAFKGVPNAKPRKPKPVSVEAGQICTCCKQVHTAEKVTAMSSDGDKKSDEKSNEKSNKNPDEKKSEAKPDTQTAGAQTHSNRAEETYSADDDATITAMKTAGKNWKEILAAINKESLSQLKSHWKLIDPTPKESEGGDSKKVEEDAEAKKKEEEEKQAMIEKAKAEGQAAKKKKKEQEKNEAVVVVEKEKEKRKNVEKTVVGANDMKTFASQYDKQKWKAAASRHFDLTGQRISPEAARKMAEE